MYFPHFLLGALLFTLSAATGLPRAAQDRPPALKPAADPQAADTAGLQPGRPLRRDLKAGERHLYQLNLPATHFIHVLVAQHGIDVVVALIGPDGKVLSEVDSPNGNWGEEPLSWVAEKAGTYGLEVRPLEKGPGAGAYSVELVETREAAPNDKKRVEAERALTAGERLRAQGTAAAVKESVGKYEEAEALWQSAGRASQAAAALHRQVWALVGLNLLPDALPRARKALAILEREHGPDDPQVFNGVAILADVLARQGNFSEARSLYERSLKAVEKMHGAESLQAAHALLPTANVTAYTDLDAALLMYERAVKIYEKDPSGATSAATARVWKANSLWGQGRAAEARPEYERAVQIYEKSVAPDQYLVNVLGPLANLLATLRDFPAARAAAERLLKISEHLSGAESPNTAQALMVLAEVLTQAGDLGATRAAFGRALKIHEKSSGADSPAVAAILMSGGGMLARLGDTPSAFAAYERALKLYEANEGKSSLAVASVVALRARLHDELDDHDRARAGFERVLQIYEERAGPESLEAAWALKELANLHGEQQNFNEALRALGRALSILEKKHGAESPALLEVLSDTAGALVGQGKLSGARQSLERALKILEKTPNPDASEMADVFKGFGLVLLAEGSYADSDEFLRRSIETYAASPRANDGDLADLLYVRGYALLIKGDLVAARALFERGLGLLERGGGGPEAASAVPILLGLSAISGVQGDLATAVEHIKKAERLARVKNTFDSGIATALQFSAILANRQGKNEAADALFKEAIGVMESALGPDHIFVADILSNHAQLKVDSGDYAAAEKLIERTIRIYEAGLGAEHFAIAQSRALKANMLRRQGKVAESHAALGESLRLIEKTLSETHFIRAALLNEIGRVELELDAADRARASFMAAGRITDSHVRNVLPTLSFAEQRVFLDEELPTYTSELLATCAEGDALRPAYELIFRWKGLLIDSLRQQTLIDRMGRLPQHKTQVARLRELRAEIAGWYHKAGVTPAARWQERNDSLTRDKEALERELKRSLGPGDQDDPLAGGLRAAQSSLKSDEVFLDVYLYDSNPRYGPIINHYGGVLLAATGSPVFINFGPAEKTDAAVKAWRNEVLSGGDGRRHWREIAGLLWEPVAKIMPPAARKLLVSPDSDLSRIPWHLLPAENPKTKDVLTSQVTSARELARLRRSAQTPASAPGNMLVVGGVDFDAGVKGQAAQAGGRRFKPLRSTAIEASAVSALGRRLPARVTLLQGAHASKERVREALANSTYAHLATHGFFAREPPGPSNKVATRFRTAEPDPDQPRSARNPLVESGIALAGANVYDPENPRAEGVLTAEEIVGLDLSGCELVTLSACDTGRGEEVSGQGVIGMRASFMAAGTKSLVMSLWKVPDGATAKFMEAFYTNLWVKKMNKAEALMRAQAAVRDDPSGEYKMPVHWAAWVLAGEGW